MTTISSKQPTIEEEIERKTLETMEYICELRTTNQIDDNAYKFAFVILNQTVSGLVSKEIQKVIWKEAK